MTFARYPSLQGKPVIVTGGASGIGEATVRAFSEQGSRVGFVDLDAERGAALAAELGAAGHSAQFARCDLRDVSELNVAFATLAKAHGPARVLVNNAARDDRHRWQEVEPAYWDERVATNLRHMFFAIQAVAPAMIAAGGGSIVNLGSDSWHRAIGGLPVYATCKAAVHGLTRSFARELGAHRIRVNTVRSQLTAFRCLARIVREIRAIQTVRHRVVDIAGAVMHRWKLPTRPGRAAVLLPNGNLGYNGQHSRFESGTRPGRCGTAETFARSRRRRDCLAVRGS